MPDVMNQPRLDPLRVHSAPGLVAARIRSGIFAGRFTPDTQLNEVELATELNVSRGPIREAFARLIHEGLLRRERNRGVFVVALDADGVRDLYFVREVVERAAALRVAEQQDPAVFARLDEIVRSLDAAVAGPWADLVALDLEFHRSIVAAAGSVSLSRAFEPLYAQTRLCLANLEPRCPDRDALLDEHRAILAAIRAGAIGPIEAVIHDHLANSATTLTTHQEGDKQ
jgi:DNA-binding GntR family transcriptional regulator